MLSQTLTRQNGCSIPCGNSNNMKSSRYLVTRAKITRAKMDSLKTGAMPAAHTPVTSVSEGMSEAITLSRLKQNILSVLHENTTLDKRVHDLEQRVAEGTAAAKKAESEAARIQEQLDESIRACDEANYRAGVQAKAHEDELARRELSARLAGDNAATAKERLQLQGKQLHDLEEQLRTKTEAADRLQIQCVTILLGRPLALTASSPKPGLLDITACCVRASMHAGNYLVLWLALISR